MNDSIPLKESSFDPGLIDCLRRVADDPTSYPELDGLLRNAADTLADMYATPEGGWFAAWQAADHDRANLQRRIAESEWHPPAPPRCEANHKTAMAEIARANNGAISDEQSRVNKALDDIRLACWYGLEEDIDSKEAMLKQIDKYARDAMEPQK